MKKALRETQTLRAGCSKAEPKIFTPPRTPFPGARDSQNLISWRGSLPLPINPVWWKSMHATSSYRGNRPTNVWLRLRRLVTLCCFLGAVYKYTYLLTNTQTYADSPPIGNTRTDRTDNNTLCR